MTGNSGDVASAHGVEVRRALACVVPSSCGLDASTFKKSGIKMTIRFGQAGNSSEHILYLLYDRKCMEFRNLRSQPA